MSDGLKQFIENRGLLNDDPRLQSLYNDLPGIQVDDIIRRRCVTNSGIPLGPDPRGVIMCPTTAYCQKVCIINY